MSTKRQQASLYLAKYVLAYDNRTHYYLKNGAVLVKNGEIAFVGRADDYIADANTDVEVHDLGNYFIGPGFVNVHCHTYNSALTKSFLEDVGSEAFYGSTWYEYLNVFYGISVSSAEASAAYSLIELLKSGCTTVVEMSTFARDLLDIFNEFGIRSYLVPGYRSGPWSTTDGKRVNYDWDEAGGFRALEESARFVETYQNTDGLIRSMLGPVAVDTCSPELLKTTRSIADSLGCRIQIHACQSLNEIHEMISRHGKSSIEFLADVGLLGSDLIIAHGFYSSSHPATNLSHTRDVELLGRHGVSVAHCPSVFARQGAMLHSFNRYAERGINLSLGTDTFPQNMMREMQYAAVLAKIADRCYNSTTAADVFNAATIGGADALGRDDLGRIEQGAKADLIFVDCDQFAILPLRDPVKNLVYSGATIDKVMVDGKFLVDNGAVLGFDEHEVGMRLQRAAEQMWHHTAKHDWAQRTADELSPFSFPMIKDNF